MASSTRHYVIPLPASLFPPLYQSQPHSTNHHVLSDWPLDAPFRTYKSPYLTIKKLRRWHKVLAICSPQPADNTCLLT